MREGDSVAAGKRTLHQRADVVHCIGCSSSGSPRLRGWPAHRVDDPKTDSPSPIAFYCPTCGGQELGFSRRV